MASEPRTQRNGRMSYADIGKARHPGGWDSLCRADWWLQRWCWKGTPGPAKSQRALEIWGLTLCDRRSSMRPSFLSCESPFQGRQDPEEGIGVLISQGKLECQAPRCKCGNKCPSKLAASKWLGQSSRARSSAALDCVQLKLRQAGTAPGELDLN